MAPKIFWAGDSTVTQNNYTTYPQTGIGQGLGLYLKKDIVIRNFAENGRSSLSFIDEQRLAPIYNEMRAGDFFFIQFGHNDEKEDKARHTEPFGSYQENLTKYINVAHNRKAYPVLITPLYRRVFDENGKIQDNNHLDYPDAMIALSKKLNVPCIDLCALSKAYLSELGEEKSRRLYMNLAPGEFENYPEGKKDNSHLQYHGAVTFAGMIASELKKLGGVYASILADKFTTASIEADRAYEK